MFHLNLDNSLSQIYIYINGTIFNGPRFKTLFKNNNIEISITDSSITNILFPISRVLNGNPFIGTGTFNNINIYKGYLSALWIESGSNILLNNFIDYKIRNNVLLGYPIALRISGLDINIEKKFNEQIPPPIIDVLRPLRETVRNNFLSNPLSILTSTSYDIVITTPPADFIITINQYCNALCPNISPINAFCLISQTFTISTIDFGIRTFNTFESAVYNCPFNLIYFIDQFYIGNIYLPSLNYDSSITRSYPDPITLIISSLHPGGTIIEGFQHLISQTDDSSSTNLIISMLFTKLTFKMKVSNSIVLPLNYIPCSIDLLRNNIFSSIFNVVGYTLPIVKLNSLTITNVNFIFDIGDYINSGIY